MFDPLLQFDSFIQPETIIPSADFQFQECKARVEESNLKYSLLPFFGFRNFDNDQWTLEARDQDESFR